EYAVPQLQRLAGVAAVELGAPPLAERCDEPLPERLFVWHGAREIAAELAARLAEIDLGQETTEVVEERAHVRIAVVGLARQRLGDDAVQPVGDQRIHDPRVEETAFGDSFQDLVRISPLERQLPGGELVEED